MNGGKPPNVIRVFGEESSFGEERSRESGGLGEERSGEVEVGAVSLRKPEDKRGRDSKEGRGWGALLLGSFLMFTGPLEGFVEGAMPGLESRPGASVVARRSAWSLAFCKKVASQLAKQRKDEHWQMKMGRGPEGRLQEGGRGSTTAVQTDVILTYFARLERSAARR